jgi:hypothetical protein
MRFGGKSYADWMKWFAWRPVRAYTGKDKSSYQWAWLETIERKRSLGFEGIGLLSNYVYRFTGSKYEAMYRGTLY